MKNSLIYLYIREDRMDEWEMFVRGVCLSTDRRWFYKEEYCHRITCTILLVIPGGGGGFHHQQDGSHTLCVRVYYFQQQKG